MPPHTPKVIRIATRKSELALWQANYVREQLTCYHPDLKVELVPLTSRGDKVLNVPLTKVGGKGLFVKELETALLSREADIAVHSMKDVPMDFPQGLGLPVVCEREDPRDAWVSTRYPTLKDAPQGAVIGTSSLRRQSQLLRQRPDLDVVFLRGNVNTRLAKLDAGEYDAIILAAAGLKRLGMRDRIASFIAAEDMLPAAGQGCVGIEARLDDPTLLSMLAPLHHADSFNVVSAERAMVTRLQGGCQLPIACYGQLEGENLILRGLVGDPEGHESFYHELRGSQKDSTKIGQALAEKLLEAGADRILKRIYGT